MDAAALDVLKIHDGAVTAFSGETALAVDLGKGDRTGQTQLCRGMLISAGLKPALVESGFG
jgi:hypothetical protein